MRRGEDHPLAAPPGAAEAVSETAFTYTVAVLFIVAVCIFEVANHRVQVRQIDGLADEIARLIKAVLERPKP